MKALEWQTKKVKVKDLKPCEWNPRQATEKQKQDLTNSINKFSVADPLIVNTDMTLIGGHFRLKILNDKGIKEVDVRIPSRKLTEEEVIELNIRLNKNTGEFNFDLLANFDETLLKDIGFDSKELDAIFQIDPKPQDDDVPDERKTNIKRGDLFVLGGYTICPHCKKENNIL